IHKLYDSNKYIELEKKFNKMWKLDVSTCFDSIYTHTISWAIKNKEYIKSRVQYINQFPQQLDTLMQRSNNNETNGIPIGSEFSRIFSELIFQRIDRNIELKIRNKYRYKHNRDYVILRYVDDFILFSKSNEVSEYVFNIITDSLKEYNLSLNESKIEKYERPFCTNKSALIIKLKRLLSEFDSLLFHKSKDLMDKNMYINEIRSSSAIKRYFINNVKTIL
ncbi:RNA-directed DNA polymerase, partial [Yersinia enterocolitica]|nr:RNA-directed DNA polymerase [Yersinia enterocolitica]